MRKPYLQCTGEHWQKQRMRALVRDDFTCQFQRLGLSEGQECTCAHPETRLRFLSVHHIEERQNGGTHDLDNLASICRVHHIMIHPHMAFDLYMSDKELGEYPLREL